MTLSSLDIERLAAPISAAFPSGVNLRAGNRAEAYYRLKDARSAARAGERSAEPGEPLRLSPAWTEVRSLAVAALDAETADIEVLAWLAEAELRLHGFAGLRDVFLTCARLVKERFETLHSIDGETMEDKVAPFAGLNGISGEGTLIQPIRLSSLIPEQPFFENSLWDFQTAQRPGEEARRKKLKDAAMEAGPAAMRAQLETVSQCIDAFHDMTEALEAQCGRDAPASSGIRSVLEDVRLAIQNLAGIETARAREVSAAPLDTGTPLAPGEKPTPRPAEIRSREEAFERLIEVADYFRRTEPQSPLSLAIETAVARGRMGFPELLAELVTDEHLRRNILITAGIRPVVPGQS